MALVVILAYLKTLLVIIMQTSFDLSLCFQTADDISVLPSDLMCNTTNLAIFTVRTQAQDFHGEWNADTLLLVVRWWNALEDLQASQGDFTASSSVWNHSTDSFPEHSAGSAEVERTTSRVHIATFTQVWQELYLVSGSTKKENLKLFSNQNLQAALNLRLWSVSYGVFIMLFDIKQCR